MPRIQEYHSLRARGLCTQCGRPASTVRCPPCKAKELARKRGSKLHLMNHQKTREYLRGDGLREAEKQERAIERQRQEKYAAFIAEQDRPDDYVAPEDAAIKKRRKTLNNIARKHGHEPAPHREDTGRENTRAHASRTSHFMADRKIEAFDHIAAAERDMIKEQYATRRAKKAEKERHKGKNIVVRVKRK